MTKERVIEIKERINWLEKVLWTIDLIDHWTSEDRDLYDKYNKELKDLKKTITETIFKEEK